MLYLLAAVEAAADAPPSFWTAVIVGFIGSGAITVIMNWIFNRRKSDAETKKVEADAASVIQDTYSKFLDDIREQSEKTSNEHSKEIQELSKEIRDLKTQVARIPLLEKDIADLSQGIRLLTEQLRAHDLTPVYPPMPNGML